MVKIEKVDVANKTQVERFIRIPFRLYAGCAQWVPPFISDVRLMMDRKRHPYYDHSDAEFFIATKDGRDVGRIAALENKPFNEYHRTRDAEFYLFDAENDQETATALFDTVFEWAKRRGLNHVVGPKGFSAFDGYGIQIEGFEHRQMMTMMNYNFPYYRELVEKIGFSKEVDFVSDYMSRDTFKLPDKVRQIAEIVEQRGTFKVVSFNSKKELRDWAPRIGEAYNRTFVKNWEYYPLTQREVKFVLDNILTVAIPQLIKIIVHGEDVVGFLFAFPDVSRALQKNKGRLGPIEIVRLLRELRTTDWVSLNGAGVLPEYQGRGGNALLYTYMAKTMEDFHYQHAELTQVAETTVQMRRDLENVGGRPYKNHRVYQIHI
jgi:GNAT superfamily N-acetyltransferase